MAVGSHVAPMWPRLIRSRLIADAFGAPVLRDQGPIGRPGTARTRCKPRPTDLLLAKPDRAGSPPGQTTNGAGHGGRGIVRGCQLATARVRCECHGSGAAGEDDGGGASRRRHQVDRKVRPVLETLTCWQGPPARGSRQEGEPAVGLPSGAGRRCEGAWTCRRPGQQLVSSLRRRAALSRHWVEAASASTDRATASLLAHRSGIVLQ